MKRLVLALALGAAAASSLVGGCAGREPAPVATPVPKPARSDVVAAPSLEPDASRYVDRAGTRLTPLRFRSGTAEVTILFFDTKLRAACDFRRAADGQVRCIPERPRAFNLEKWSIDLTDASCTRQVARVNARDPMGRDPDAAYAVLAATDAVHVFALGTTTGTGVREGDRKCLSSVYRDVKTITFGDEIDPATFVAVRESIEDGVPWLIAEDGARVFAAFYDGRHPPPSTGPHQDTPIAGRIDVSLTMVGGRGYVTGLFDRDPRVRVECAGYRAEDDKLRCLPADMSARAIMLSSSNTCAKLDALVLDTRRPAPDPLRFATVHEVIDGDGPRPRSLRVYAVGERITPPRYARGPDGRCREYTTRGELRSITALPPSMFAEGEDVHDP